MFPSLDSGHQVQHTRELERIIRLPRRKWADDEAARFAEDVTARLRRPGGTMTLRPIQAVALYEAATVGGLVALIMAGGGKTLLSGLIPFVLKSKRPLLLTRANLVEKTRREFRILAQHWPIPNYIHIESYDRLGKVGHKERLRLYQPDLIVCDEAHRLKNPKAAVTRRVARWMSANPLTHFVAMSGTLTRKSLLEYAHLVKWALKSFRSPFPDPYQELVDWASALDDGDQKVGPGALVYFCNEVEKAGPDPTLAVRLAMRRRFVDTPGVVATTGTNVGSSLTIEAVETDMAPIVDQAFQEMRITWKTPDGWPLSDPMRVNAVLHELALGFFYVWDPRPPYEWLECRKAWAGFAQHILTTNRRELDSELQVINAIDAGFYPEAKEALEDWRAIEPTFTPKTVPVWLDDSVIDLAGSWAMRDGPGIIWTRHVAFAERLARKTRLTYYGEGGLSAEGRDIETHPQDESLIASVDSVGEGRNLQAWSRALVSSPMASGKTWEQMLAREHRDGQAADEVVYKAVVTALEHVTAFEKAKAQARYIEASTGQAQRILFADVMIPTPDEIAQRSGPRWRKK